MPGSIDRITPGPRWGALYALAAAIVAVFGVLEVSIPVGPWRKTLEIAIVVIGFGAIHLWARVNRRALDLARGRSSGSRRDDEPPSAPQPAELQPLRAAQQPGRRGGRPIRKVVQLARRRSTRS
jgi:hypothetical protein